MAEIINLNRVRKAKARDEKKRQADVNRAAFGRTKAEKLTDRKRAEVEKARLDGKKLDQDA